MLEGNMKGCMGKNRNESIKGGKCEEITSCEGRHPNCY